MYIYISVNVTQLEQPLPAGTGGGGTGGSSPLPPLPSPLYSLLPRRRRRNSSDSAALEVARGSGSVTRHACRPRAGGEELSQTGTQRRGAAPDTPSPPRGGSARHRRDPGGDGERGERGCPPFPLLSGSGGTCGGERSAAPPADPIATGDGLATVVVGEG